MAERNMFMYVSIIDWNSLNVHRHIINAPEKDGTQKMEETKSESKMTKKQRFSSDLQLKTYNLNIK